MNYIKQLQAENQRLKDEIAMIHDELLNFISFLHSDKFRGVQSDGARKDWISTTDVINRLIEIKNIRAE